MKFLILCENQSHRWNRGHQQFRDSIGRVHDARYYGPKYDIYNSLSKTNHVPTILQYYEAAEDWVPDFIITWHWRYTLPFMGLGEVKVKKIHLLCDFTGAIPGFAGNLGQYWPLCLRDKYDIYFAASYQVMRWFKQNAPMERIHYLPFGVDETVFRPMRVEDKWDVFTGWSLYDAVYPLRGPIEKILRGNLGDLRLNISRVFGEAFVRTINESLVVLNTSNAYHTMNQKTFEVMACGRLLLTERVQEMTDLGYKDMIHYVAFSNPIEVIDKIRMLIKHPKMREEIANYGYYLTLKKNTNLHRVEEMTNVLRDTF